MKNKNEFSTARYESHSCTRDELGDHYDTGRLYICPPMDKLHIQNNYEYFPQIHIEFVISPNYDNAKDEKDRKEVQKEVDYFEVAREQMNNIQDLSIVGPDPLRRKANWYGRYQLEFGYQQHGDCLLKRV